MAIQDAMAHMTTDHLTAAEVVAEVMAIEVIAAQEASLAATVSR